MTKMTIDDLQRIARDVIGDRTIVIEPSMSAADVPGWDSLNHTLVMLDISDLVGVDISARDTADLPTMGALVDHVNAQL